MTRNELLAKLQTYNVPPSLFSLNDGLKPDAFILSESNGVWEGFYFDEKGNEHDRTFYPSEEIAYDFLWVKLEREMPYQTLWQASIPTGVMCCCT